MKDVFGEELLASILKNIEAQSILPDLDANRIEDLAALAATRVSLENANGERHFLEILSY